MHKLLRTLKCGHTPMKTLDLSDDIYYKSKREREREVKGRIRRERDGGGGGGGLDERYQYLCLIFITD